MVSPKTNQPYGFAPNFEAAVVTLACCRPKFYGRVGHALDTELLTSPTAKRALEAANAIAQELGHGPSSTLLVTQRLRRWMQDGKVTFEQVREVAELFDDAEDAGLPGEEDVVNELAPILQRRLRDEAVHAAIDSFGKSNDLSKVVALEERATRIGQVDTSVGTVLGAASFEEIAQLKQLERLKTGVVELDDVLSGGLQRSALGVVIGGSGDGKSMFLSHVGGISVLGGLHVAYATLELPRPIVLARLKANMTGITINDILDGSTLAAQKRLEAIGPRIGRCVVQEFTAHATTVEDIKEWVAKVEDHAGRPIDLLIVDYGDKLTAKAKKGEKEAGEYTMGRIVFEGLRVYAVERKLFCWTASQASRVKDSKNKRLDLNDVADSMHKIRVADLVVTLNLRGEGDEMLFYVAKHRTGKSRVQVGPLPIEFECGRVAPVVFTDEGLVA